MTTTYKQKEEKAINYLKEKGISFGSRDADDSAISIFIAGMTDREEVYEHTVKEFKDAYLSLFKFHCDEIVKCYE